MALEQRRPPLARTREDERAALATQWRGLSQAATAVALLTSPVAFVWLSTVADLPVGWALVLTFLIVIAFRGLVDLICHRFIPRASLYGAGRDLQQQDVVDRRRLWYWRAKYRKLLVLAIIVGIPILALDLVFGTTPAGAWRSFSDYISDPNNAALFLSMGIQLPLLFLINFGILFGPMLVLGMRQMKGYEPGDADWGVKLDDIRGQAEQKEEVTRVISLWQAGDDFRKAGGKPERGLLFLGAPGTGKTMLSKGIATSFNSPIVTMPGSGFAQTFIGMDVIIVQALIRKARKLARKWGGTCIIFIDEIDAVGLRRQSLGAGAGMQPLTDTSPAYYGPWGAVNPTGDLVAESEAWREHLFQLRAPERRSGYPDAMLRLVDRTHNFIGGMGGMGGGGGMALNQLLVQMDGVDEPPFFRKLFTRRINTFLDATYVVPQKLLGKRLRLKPARPRGEEIYFIGATNVPIQMLDPALVRPGRMGRHIWFKTPDLKARRDIFDLYLAKVDHVPELDTDAMRRQLARITGGWSPAMIEQCCSMALTYAHSDGRTAFEWRDIVEAITTIESGTAQDGDYARTESRATAIHEAGHAVASHLYHDNMESTRLSIRPRGGSGGHHQAREIEERDFPFRHVLVGGLVWGLGALAAEHVFYGENSVGVGGDLGMTTHAAARMVGVHGFGPEPVDLTGRVGADEQDAREKAIYDRFEKIGMQLMNRAANPMQSDNVTSALQDRYKKRAAAILMGQAYITALACMRHNREAVAHVAQVLVDRHELYGDEVVQLLDAVGLERPVIDLLDEACWPRLA